MWLQVMISMSYDNGFGEYLRQIRESRGLGVNQLAVKSGVSNAEISRIENGERKRPHPDTLIKLAKALNHPVEDFYLRLGYLEGDLVTEQSNIDYLSGIIGRVTSLASRAGYSLDRLAKLIDSSASDLAAMSDEDPDLAIVQRLAYHLNTTMHYLLGKIDDPSPLPGVAVAHHDPEKGVDIAEPLPPQTQLIVERAILEAKREWGWNKQTD